MNHELGTSFHSHIQTTIDRVRGVASSVEKARSTIGTPQGPAFYNLDQVAPQELLKVGASLATELTVLQTAATETLPKIIDSLEKALEPSPEFAAIKEAHERGAMSDTIYQKLEQAFAQERISLVEAYINPDWLDTEKSGIDLEEDLPDTEEMITSGPEDYPNSYTAPDGTIFYDRKAKYLAAMSDSRPDFPFRRDLIAKAVFGNEVKNPKASLSVLLYENREEFKNHGIVIESYVPKDRTKGAKTHDWMVIVKDEQAVTSHNGPTDAETSQDPEQHAPEEAIQDAEGSLNNIGHVSTESESESVTGVEEVLSPVLSKDETHFLGQLLLNSDEDLLAKLSITLPPGEKKELEETVTRLAKDQDFAGAKDDFLQRVRAKLVAFAQDQAGVFTANLENEDSSYLLTVLSSLQSAKQIDELLTSPDVKKN